MTVQKRQVGTFNISPEDVKQLERIALDMGCFWGDRPNVSEMLRRIANGEIVLIYRGEQTQNTQELLSAINKAMSALIEIQQIFFK